MESSPIDSPIKPSTRSKSPSTPVDADLLGSATLPKAAQAPPRSVRSRRLVFSLAELKRAAEDRRRGRRQEAGEARGDVAEKSPPLPPPKGRSGKDVLPGKFEALVRCFDCLQSSLRLLQLKKTMPTFANVSRSVEALLERRFTYAHLAQLKYILQDLLNIERVVVHDARTLCMKPELHINLLFDGCGKESKGKETKYVGMRKEFLARLANFAKAHPLADQVPEGQLPEPFNQAITCTNTASEPHVTVAASASQEPSLISSHFTPSFQRRFSKRASFMGRVVTPDVPTAATLKSPGAAVSHSCQNMLQSPSISSSSWAANKISIFDSKASPANIKRNDHEKVEIICTPVRLSPASLTPVNDTPDLTSPKRPHPCQDESPCKTLRHTTHIRSLKFQSPIRSVEEDGKRERRKSSVTDEDILRFLPTALVQSVKEKEERAQEERDHGVAEMRRRKQMIACLPKLFDMIYLVFQSTNKSLMTRQELLHKIVSYHTNVVDIRDVEEQLNLLQQILPDWISEKKISSGDLVVCVGKLSTSEAIHARLAEAKKNSASSASVSQDIPA